MEAVNALIEKISQYNFLTNILPGTVLCLILQYLLGYNVIPDDAYSAAVVFYFAGLVNGRVGSLIVMPFLKTIKLIVYEPYPKYIEAEKKDKKVAILSQENNTYRAYLSVMFISLLALGYQNCVCICVYVKNHETAFLLSALFVLFLLSYMKQSGFVRKRIEHHNEAKE